MISSIISRVVILLLGTLYPAYASYKAVKTKNVKEYVKWMMYWIVFALFTCAETLADTFVSWLPFYYELKIVFVLWLLSPATNGSSILYRKFVHPQLSKREKEIDSAIAKASEQGYSTFITLGTRGISYATNVLITTAVKGQAKLVDHVKKSYSMSDLSADGGNQDFVDGRRRRDNRATDSEDDDELDNRLLEERYNREMIEMAAGGTSGQSLSRQSLHKAKEAELYPLDESDEVGGDDRVAAGAKASRSKKISHKDAAHYATLPRSGTRSRHVRAPINKAN
jgi:receptor expression-enhancing protein 1/2/3/4